MVFYFVFGGVGCFLGFFVVVVWFGFGDVVGIDYRYGSFHAQKTCPVRSQSGLHFLLTLYKAGLDFLPLLPV